MTNLSSTAEEAVVLSVPVPDHLHPELRQPLPTLGAGLASSSATTAEEVWPKPQEEPNKKRRYISPVDQGGNWLMGEPYSWIGRKVRNRSNAAIYMVRQVFKNGRVQLERNWMSYMTDVNTIREKYEPQV